MSDIITAALAVANKNSARLTRVQVFHLTSAGLLGMNEEGEFIVTEKATRKVARGKNKATHRTPILKNLQALRDSGVLTQHKRGNSNFGIYYTSGPNWA